MSAPAPIRLLYWTREEFPTFRVDVDVLFGKELIRRGHHIDFVMQADRPDIPTGPQPWRGRTVYVGKTATGSTVARFTKHWHSFWHDLVSLVKLARRDRYDAIQFRDTFVVASLGILVARWRGLKYFYWLSFPYPEADIHHADAGETRFPALARLRGRLSAWLLYRWILPRADHAFVQSDRMKQDIMREGIAAEKMTPVPMGIAEEDIQRMPAAVDRPASDEVVLGYLGALNADRHIETLVDTLALLRRDRIPARLLLVGDAFDLADRQALQARAVELGVADHFEITGNLPRDEALRRMLDVDVAFSPYYPVPIFLSTSPTKLVEYLALGIPVVANHHPEQKAILRASGAGISTPWGPRYFARGARFLIAAGKARRRELGRTGREWVMQNRLYRTIGDHVEARYFAMLADPTSRTGGTTCAS
jgi:glycosyltransferase involved in cell wall biosynthesis